MLVMLVPTFQHGQAPQIILSWTSLALTGKASLRLEVQGKKSVFLILLQGESLGTPFPQSSQFGCGASSKICWDMEQKWGPGVFSGEDHLAKDSLKYPKSYKSYTSTWELLSQRGLLLPQVPCSGLLSHP